MLFRNIKRNLLWHSKSRRAMTLDPDEILIDASNLPSYDTDQFEGRVSKPIGYKTSIGVFIFFALVACTFAYRAWDLQISRGASFATLSEQNRLAHAVLFADRGVVYARDGEELIWNMPSDEDFSKRVYTQHSGLSHLLGFVSYPQKDASGNLWREEYVGKSGVEQSFDDLLAGENGLKIVEVDATNELQSENTIRLAHAGKNLTLSVDAAVQESLYNAISESTGRAGYVGGAGVVVDVDTGELIALTSYPEFSSEVLSEGEDSELIASYAGDSQQPFLNRVIGATYAPGSIVKPYIAAAALAEGIISQYKQILSTGVMLVPNPYNPAAPSRFLDWQANGLMDMRHAIAWSSNIYFYAVGGGLAANIGLGVQEGLGIDRLAGYAKRFGFGQKTGIALYGEKEGNVPTPKWKEETFGEDWLLGNTYHSSIGQYGWLMTPLQAAMYTAALANGGELLHPQILHDAPRDSQSIGIDDEYLQVAREGMRLAVTEGTLKALYYGDMRIAAKTGTAQVGSNNEYKNSWVIGFWPSNKPKFAFAIVLERAPATQSYGAVDTSISFFNSLRANEPEYARGKYPQDSVSE